jgi:hypothetical protein
LLLLDTAVCSYLLLNCGLRSAARVLLIRLSCSVWELSFCNLMIIVSMGWDYVCELRHQRVYRSSPKWYMSMENHGGKISIGEKNWFAHQSCGNTISSHLVTMQ